MEALEVFLGDIKSDPSLKGDKLVLRAEKVRGKRRDLSVPNTATTERMRAEMTLINIWIAQADLSWMGDDEERPVDLSHRFLRRIFNVSLEGGGRLYGGFWQGLRSEDRLDYLRFKGERCAALDFGQMAVRAAYSEVGELPPEGDLYEVPGLERYRYGVKLVLNALLSASETPQRFPPGTRGDIPRHIPYKDVLRAIELRHAPITPMFGSGASLRLMHLESKVLVSVLLKLRERQVVALPIHDCLLVAVSDQETARVTMEEVFLEVLGSRPSIAEYTSEAWYTPTVAPAAPHKKGA